VGPEWYWSGSGAGGIKLDPEQPRAALEQIRSGWVRSGTRVGPEPVWSGFGVGPERVWSRPIVPDFVFHPLHCHPSIHHNTVSTTTCESVVSKLCNGPRWLCPLYMERSREFNSESTNTLFLCSALRSIHTQEIDLLVVGPPYRVHAPGHGTYLPTWRR